MSNVKHIYIAVGIIVAALILHAYISTQGNIAKLEQVHDDMKPVHSEADAQKKSAIVAEDGNQKALLATLASIASQKQAPVSTQVDYDRIAAMIEQRIGTKATVEKPVDGLGDSPSTVKLEGPQAAKKLRDYMFDCDQKDAEINSCKVSVKNTQDLLEAEKKDHAADKNELVAAKKAAKGGSFLHRLKSSSRALAMGAAIGAVAVTVLKKK